MQFNNIDKVIFDLIESEAKKNIDISRSEYDKKKRFKLQSNDGKELVFFGAEHSNDPNHLQFREIKNELINLFEGVDSNKSTTIIESRRPIRNKVQPKDLLQSIVDGGEPEFAYVLAKNLGIEVFCFEPTNTAQIHFVNKRFPSDLVFLAFVGRNIENFSNQNTDGLRQYLTIWLEEFARDSGWKNYDFSFNNLEKIYEQLTNRKFTPNEKENFKKLYDPMRDTSKLNEVSRYISIFRDFHIATGVRSLIKQGKTCFYCVYGSGHALNLKSALEYVLTN